jgi:predicted DNA-binding transcriptional regulator AlpA
MGADPVFTLCTRDPLMSRATLDRSPSHHSIIPPADALPDQPVVSPTQLAHHWLVSRRTIWAWVARGLLPRPTHFSRNVVRWERSVLVAFLQQLKTQPF